VPLDSFETVINSLRTTTTNTGLRVTACFDQRDYATGLKPTKSDMALVHIEPHKTLPAWNYTLRPADSA